MSRLLCVDDDEDIRKVYGRLLRGHDLTIVSNPSEAINSMQVDPKFDRIFCDWSMGPYCGEELYRWVEVTHPDLMSRFVFVSGSHEDIQKSLGDGPVVINKLDMAVKLKRMLL